MRRTRLPGSLLSRTPRGLTIAVLAVASSACSNGGGNDVSPSEVSAAGIWTITETVTQADPPCDGEQGTVETYQISVQQNGSQLSVTTPVGTFGGSIDGSGRVSWTGSYPEDGGTTTITSMSITVSGDSLSGSTTWSFTDGTISCNGSTSITGSRVPSSSPAGAARVFVADAIHDRLDAEPWLALAARDRIGSQDWSILGTFADGRVLDLDAGTWRLVLAPATGIVGDATTLPLEAIELAEPLRILGGRTTLRLADLPTDWVSPR